MQTRTADLSFLVSELSNKTFTSSLFADLPATFDPHKIAAFGHSLGGATAAIATQQDPRVIGGLNLDGQIFGNVLENGFKEKPFVLVATTRGQNSSDLALPGWDEFYKVVDARKMELAIKDTQHNAFLDVPLLLTALEIPTGIRPRLEQAFGMLDGRRLEMVEHKIMSGLLELLFHDKTETLEALGKDPDIDVLKSDLYEGE